MKTTKFRVVLVTCGELKEARTIARSVVSARVAACVNISATPVESIYRWKGKVEVAREYLLIVKTSERRLKQLEKTVRELHSYEVPEFIVLPVSGGSREYLDWVGKSLMAR